jgi:hypothetical protein
MNDGSSISHINEARSAHGVKSNASPEKIEKLSSVYVDGLILVSQQVFDRTDDSLFDLANNARSNNEQNRYFEAMREVRLKRKRVERKFIDSVKNNFQPDSVLRDPRPSGAAEVQQSNVLSLVSEQNLEKDIAVTNMANKLEAGLQSQFLLNRHRVWALYTGSEALDNANQFNNPFSAINLCKGFSEACSQIEIELAERLLLFKQFDKQVMARLGNIIDNMNGMMADLGILPNLSDRDIRASLTNKQTPSRANASKGSISASQAAAEQTPDNFSTMQRLLHDLNQSSSSHAASSGANISLSSDDVLSLLTMLQHAELEKRHNQKSLLDIEQAIRDSVDSIQPSVSKSLDDNQIQETDLELINLVAMLFEFILDDYNLAPSIQVLISRLQIPILKVVIKDSSFFNTSQHPARQLLNTLAKAGIGWTEHQEKRNDPLHAKIHETVHFLLDNFEGDLSLFSKLNQEFNDYLQRDDRRTAIIEQRTRKSEEGRIKGRKAQQEVDLRINRLADSIHTPLQKPITHLLKKAWGRVMFLAYLKDEQEHQWEKACRTAEDLIWCSQPVSDPADRQKWVATVPKLLKEIEQGLESISYSTEELSIDLNEIKRLLTKQFKESAVYDSNIVDASKRAKQQLLETKRYNELGQQPSDVNSNERSQDPEHQACFRAIEALEEGQWFEFTDAKRQKLRWKLTSIVNDADSYIFVNRMGLQPIEKTKAELAKHLSTKSATILEQGALIDRAIHSVINALKQEK